MNNVVQLFASSDEDESGDFVPPLPVDEGEAMRLRVNRIYRRRLAERGLAAADMGTGDDTRAERSVAARLASSDHWSAEDQAEVDAWLESDPWASRLAMKLDELAKDSGAATSPREADSGKRLITDQPSDKCDASTYWPTTPTRGPKKAGAVPTRGGGALPSPSSSPSRVGSLAARDPPRRFLAPVEGPAEVVESIVFVEPDSTGGAGSTKAGEPKSEMEASMGLTEKQRAIADAYNAGVATKTIADKLGIGVQSVHSTVSALRKRAGVITRARGPSGPRPKSKLAAAPVRAPKKASAPRVARDEDPLVAQLRARRVEAIAEHSKKLAGIDAAIKALGGSP